MNFIPRFQNQVLTTCYQGWIWTFCRAGIQSGAWDYWFLLKEMPVPAE